MRKFSVSDAGLRAFYSTDFCGNVECVRVAQHLGTEEPRAVFRCSLGAFLEPWLSSVLRSASANQREPVDVCEIRPNCMPRSNPAFAGLWKIHFGAVAHFCILCLGSLSAFSPWPHAVKMRRMKNVVFFCFFPPLYIHDRLHPAAAVSPACDYERFKSGIVMSVGRIHQAGSRSPVFVRRGRVAKVVVRHGRSRMRGFSGRDIQSSRVCI